jgi:alcohol dehydrogenase class IV
MNESSLGCKWGALSALCAGDDTAYGLDIIDNRSASHERVGLPDPADRVEALNEQLGLPRRLSELGVDYKDLESISNASVQDQANRSNPKTMSALDYLKILKQAY